MNEEFMKHFGWVGDLLNQELTEYYHIDSAEYKILDHLKEGWGKRDGIKLLKELDEKYGDSAKQTLDQFLKVNHLRYWAKTGEKEAHEGTEIDDFIKTLWEPLKETGFVFDYKKEDNIVEFNVIKCPVYDLAEKTGMHDWFYSIACMSDFYTTPSFSKNIGFTRTKSFMQGDGCCNHTYYYKRNITNDTLLGYCGLFCGSCPNYQKTVAVVPISFKKDNFYEPCLGCNSEIRTRHCANCEIMKCNKKKNIRICYDCEDFPCEIMKNFINDSRYPYHKEVENNMKLLKEKGLNEWAKIQEDKYICKKCNTILNFFQKKCNKCGTEIN